MMSDELSVKAVSQNYIAELLKRAREAVTEARADRQDEFKAGKSEAYYEVLSIIQARLEVNGLNLSEFALDVNLEADFI